MLVCESYGESFSLSLPSFHTHPPEGREPGHLKLASVVFIRLSASDQLPLSSRRTLSAEAFARHTRQGSAGLQMAYDAREITTFVKLLVMIESLKWKECLRSTIGNRVRTTASDLFPTPDLLPTVSYNRRESPDPIQDRLPRTLYMSSRHIRAVCRSDQTGVFRKDCNWTNSECCLSQPKRDRLSNDTPHVSMKGRSGNRMNDTHIPFHECVWAFWMMTSCWSH